MKMLSRTAGLLLCTTIGAFAVPVTFQVNMEYQATNASPSFVPGTDSVQIRGNWTGGNNFGNGSNLVQDTSSPYYLYTNTFDFSDAPGTVIQYKFHTFGTHDVWELGSDNYMYTNGGNRAFVMSGAPQTLLPVYFNDTWGGSVSFNVAVDMSAAITAGTFVPPPAGTDKVELKGYFNGWGAGVLLTNNGGTVYFGTTAMPVAPPGRPAPGGLCPYKFHTYGTHDVWESDPNRLIVVTNSVTSAPLDCFNRTCAAPTPVAVYLQVDMSSQILAGNFVDDANHQVWADGDFLGGWGDPPQGLQMFEDTTRPGIFTNYWTGNFSPGASFPFKYKIWSTVTLGGTFEAMANNRVITWTGAEPTDANGFHAQTNGPVLFSNVQANQNDYLPADTWVTFTVNMTNAVGVTNNNQAHGGVTWDAAQHSIWINGLFVNPQGVPFSAKWWSWVVNPGVDPLPDAAYQLTNNPVGSELYSQSILILKGTPIRLQYKYAIDGMDDETGSGADRFREIRSLGFPTYAFPLDTFGTNYVEPTSPTSLTIGSASAGKVPVSWLGRPGVHLQTKASLSGGSWTDLVKTDGTNWTAGSSSPDGFVSVTNYPVGGSPTFFRLIKPAQ